MPRAVRMTVCSNCLGDFPDKEMYTVGKAGNWAKPDDVTYYFILLSIIIKSFYQISNKSRIFT